jgi:hypothetical protein
LKYYELEVIMAELVPAGLKTYKGTQTCFYFAFLFALAKPRVRQLMLGSVKVSVVRRVAVTLAL